MHQGQALATVGRAADFIAVSPEMTALIGPDVAEAPIPARPIALIATLAAGVCSLKVDPKPRIKTLLAESDGARLIFLVKREAIARLGGGDLLEGEAIGFHLTAELRTIALALRDATGAEAARATYRLAKSIEFVCETLRQFAAGALAPLTSDGQLSSADTHRVIAARRMIDDRASEKLTLDQIARGCGLNRSKLTRGFKDLFNCTVAEAIAERRLDLARRMLLTTDLPVSSIGYESGYLNNASFARAFGRRFGRSPSDFRVQGLAA